MDVWRAFLQEKYKIRNENTIDEICENLMEKKVKAKDYLFRIGDEENMCWMLVSGVFRGIYITSNGKELTECLVFTPGRCLYSGADVCIGRKADISFQALVDCELVGISTELLLDLLKKDFDVQNWFRINLGMAYDDILELNSVRTFSARDRITWFYENKREICDQIEDQYIASYLGLDRSVFCRVKKSILKN